jgi:hypothetical protein
MTDRQSEIGATQSEIGATNTQVRLQLHMIVNSLSIQLMKTRLKITVQKFER